MIWDLTIRFNLRFTHHWSLVFRQKSTKKQMQIDSVVAETQSVQEWLHLLIKNVVLNDHENIVKML